MNAQVMGKLQKPQTSEYLLEKKQFYSRLFWTNIDLTLFYPILNNFQHFIRFLKLICPEIQGCRKQTMSLFGLSEDRKDLEDF